MAGGAEVTGRDRLCALLLPHWRAEHGDEPMWMGCDDGWLDLIENVHHQIAAICPHYRLREVFQKYGHLEFRVAGIPDSISITVDACILLAELLSLEQCEACGQPGQLALDPNGWLEVVCREHAELGRHTSQIGEPLVW